MPQITLNIRQENYDRLQMLVDEHNANTGQALTLPQYCKRRLLEVAIQREVDAQIETLRENSKTALAAAIAAARTTIAGE